MGRGSIVTAPDGGRWRVRRRWLERPMPSLRRLWRQGREEATDVNPLDVGWWGAEVDSLWLPVAAVVVVAVIFFVILPLLGVALELIGVLFLLASGIFGRVVLHRPWIVIAEKIGDPEERVAFAVEGWRDSNEALRELRTTIAAAGPPERLARGEKLATNPAPRPGA
jgi:hypothetical protein